MKTLHPWSDGPSKITYVHPKVPVQQIRMLVGSWHVAEPDLWVVQQMWKRTAHFPNVAWRKQAVRFALRVHGENRELVRKFRL